MTDPTTQWYLDYMQRELEQLKEGKFTENIYFKISLIDGGIANCNTNLNKLVKKPSFILNKENNK